LLHGAVVTVEILRFAQNDKLNTNSKEPAGCRRYKRKFAGETPFIHQDEPTVERTRQ
jgi:hypothetical protein